MHLRFIRVLKNWLIINLLCIVAIGLSACTTSSVLISPNDVTFNQSQERMDRTLKSVTEINAPSAESTLFIQAESFYRYRYTPPPHDTSFYLISAASAVTDFPGFQSQAGSLNLLDLRVRASDSAVQLWETLLLRYPQTKLRPLTLYRLGWAYRYAGASGLPRESSDETFEILAREQPASQLAALAKEAKSVPWKSKSTASSKSLVPGLGQLYVDEASSGYTRLAIAIVAAVAIVVPVYQASNMDRELNWNQDWPLLATSLAGLIVLSFDYTSSYEDSMRGVVDWNERKEGEFNLKHPEAP